MPTSRLSTRRSRPRPGGVAELAGQNCPSTIIVISWRGAPPARAAAAGGWARGAGARAPAWLREEATELGGVRGGRWRKWGPTRGKRGRERQAITPREGDVENCGHGAPVTFCGVSSAGQDSLWTWRVIVVCAVECPLLAPPAFAYLRCYRPKLFLYARVAVSMRLRLKLCRRAAHYYAAGAQRAAVLRGRTCSCRTTARPVAAAPTKLSL